MNLKRTLETQPDDRVLYVGAASSFLVGGLKEKILADIPKQDALFLKKAEAKRKDILCQYNRELKVNGETAVAESLHEAYLSVVDPVPLMEREVVMVYDRETERATNIIIDGTEAGTLWSVNEKVPLELEYNVDILVGAILRDVIREYKVRFGAELDTFRKLILRLEDYRKKSEDMERYLRSKDALMFMGGLDPEYIINRARDSILQTLAEKRKKKP